MSVGRIILYIFLGLFVLFAASFVRMLSVTGALADYLPFQTGKCVPVPDIVGGEDIVIDEDRGLAYISSSDKRAEAPPRGTVYALTLFKEKPTLHRVSPPEPRDFQPLGMGLYRDADGTKRLFVVNRAPGPVRVEIFNIERNGTLSHLETIAHPAFFAGNNIAPVGKRAFYLTNDIYFPEDSFLRAFEIMLGLPFANLVYFDGKEAREAAGGFAFANGVALSKGGSELYVAETMGHRLHAYARNPDTGVLTQGTSTRLDFGPDNLGVAANGDVWVAGPVNTFDFIAHIEDINANVASRVVRIRPGKNALNKTTLSVETIYHNMGEGVSASSAAIPYKNRLLIGAVMDDHIVMCTLPDGANPPVATAPEGS